MPDEFSNSFRNSIQINYKVSLNFVGLQVKTLPRCATYFFDQAFAKYLFITTNRLFDNFQFQIRWFQDHHSRVRFSSELLLSLRSDGDLWFASRIDNKNNSITCCGVLSTNIFNYIVNWYCETDTYAQRDYSLKLQVHRKQSRAHRRWPGLR